MRSIGERLREIQPEPASAQPDAVTSVPIHQIATGSERSTKHGSHFLIERALPDPTSGVLTSTSLKIPWSVVKSGAGDQSVSHRDILFLDTETTGLDRGTGTHVFLVGVGFFEGFEFRVHQYFLRELYEEPSLLSDLEKLISQFSVLVTYNGRGFDWPVLSNRFILHGYRNIPELSHWDLLHSARRVWRNRLRDCSLGNIERSVLGVHRIGDVPGYLIPALYFEYLRSKDARPLLPVLSHNEEDIVSLAKLAEILVRCDEDPLSVLSDPTDRLSYGIAMLRNGDETTGEQLILSTCDDERVDADLKYRGTRLLADQFKRQRRYGEAIRLWNSMLDQRWPEVDQAIYPLVELAKYYEHQVRDFRSAIRCVERAVEVVSLRESTLQRSELAHRYSRLVRKTNPETRSEFPLEEQVAE